MNPNQEDKAVAREAGPKSIGIIMDGNRRWAREKKLPIAKGHTAGYQVLRKLGEWAREEQIQTVIVYAFSTENWKRSAGEVKNLIKIFQEGLKQQIDSADQDQIRVKFIGERKRFPGKLQNLMNELEAVTAKYKKETLAVAVSYGGRAEIVRAANQLFETKVKKVNEKNFSKELWTADLPDPDLIIRTGGEQRLSNFLLWQSAYAELFFTKTLWPDFTQKDFTQIIDNYKKRQRRLGQ